MSDEIDQFWAPGSAVLSVGTGEGNGETLAVWQVSPAGAPTGAWVMPLAEVLSSAEQARRVLALVERRAIATTHAEDVVAWLEKLGAAAEVDAGTWWTPHLFSPIDAFTETLERRSRYERTVDEERRQSKTITPLEWAHDLPDDLAVQTTDDLRKLAGIGEPAGVPVVAEALASVRLLRWIVAVWEETEQVKNRRRYVRDAHGAPEGLPPSWLSAVTTAQETRLPL